MLKYKAQNNYIIANWLFVCCSAIFMMVVLGGLTRLTSSGLSIVKWEPLSGALPPLSTAKWQEYFEAYKQIPEYSQVNKGMSLGEFQGIFWLEYFHRLLGRLIGVIFFVPFIYFLARGYLHKKYTWKFIGIFALGAVQGFVGWYMVTSGFSERTDVSQYRLAIHLALAFLIYAIIYWTALDIKYNSPRLWHFCPLGRFAALVLAMVFIMVILGAFMAGTDAGFTYNTFPLMDGRIIPRNLHALSPWWLNHFENITMIQFQHRIFAYVLAITIFVFANKLVRRDFDHICLAIALTACVIVQIALGIMTLYAFADHAGAEKSALAYKNALNIPVLIAALHQVNALMLFTIALKTFHKLARSGSFTHNRHVI